MPPPPTPPAPTNHPPPIPTEPGLYPHPHPLQPILGCNSPLQEMKIGREGGGQAWGGEEGEEAEEGEEVLEPT